MANIVITGGSGYIGSHIASIFAKAGHNVYSLDRIYRDWSHCNTIHSCVMDLQDYDEIIRVFKTIDNIDCIIHCAGELGIKRSFKEKKLFYCQNVFVTDCILRVAVDFQVKNLIFASSASVYADLHRPVSVKDAINNTPSPYSLTKIICENRIKQVARYKEMNFIIFRYFNVVGCDPLDEHMYDIYINKPNLFPLLIKACKNDTPLMINGAHYNTKDGTCVRDYINVCNLAKLHLLAFERMSTDLWEKRFNGIYNAGVGKGYSVRDIITLCSQVSNKEIRTIETEKRLGDCPYLCADINETVQIFNWSPFYTVEETFRQLFSKM